MHSFDFSRFSIKRSNFFLKNSFWTVSDTFQRVKTYSRSSILLKKTVIRLPVPSRKCACVEVIKIMTEIAMRHGIILKASKTDESLIELMEFCDTDTEFMTRLRQSLAQGEKMSNVDTWFPYPMMRSRFLLQYNIRYGSISDSLYSKSEYFFQLLPCLEFTYALRKAFGVPVGVGRILNADEVMTYRYDPPSRSWHVWFVSLTLYLSI